MIENNNNGHNDQSQMWNGGTIDLQGIASFARLVELVGQELGTTPGKMHGLLPGGPAAFEELVGEIVVHGQGFQRHLIFKARPGATLNLQFYCSWMNPGGDAAYDTTNGIESHFFLNSTVEEILPQGRALARYIEDVFRILDSMVTLGQTGRVPNMAIPSSDIEAFEATQMDSLVRNFSTTTTTTR
jgi:hypothetical protein